LEPPRRHGWEVLVELAAYLGTPLSYAGVFEIQREVAAAHPELAAIGTPPAPDPPPEPVLLGAARP
jgi:predicted molibdopterin-dependent oxidoreductase YjgC